MKKSEKSTEKLERTSITVEVPERLTTRRYGDGKMRIF